MTVGGLLSRLSSLLVIVAVLASCFERGQSSTSEPPPTTSTELPAAPPRSPASEPTGAADSQATIHIALEAEPAHLNPIFAADTMAVRLTLGDVYEGLLCQDTPSAPIRGCLAESWSVSDDGRSWRFVLRPNVLWHDGTALDSADVLYSVGLVHGPSKVPTVLTSEFEDVVSVDRPAAGVVDIRFTTARPGRAQAIASLPIVPRARWKGVAPEDILRNGASRRPVGTGPLRFASWKPGTSLRFERFAGYWGPPARAAAVEYHLFSSRAQLVANVGLGKVDLAMQLPFDEVFAALDKHPRLSYFVYEMPAYTAAVFNLRNPLLADAASRIDLVKLLDRGAIVDAVYRGRGRVITGPYLPGFGDPTIVPYAFAPDQVARDRGPDKLSLLIPAESKTMGKIADIWREDAAQSYALDIVKAPFAQMLSQVREGTFDIALLSFTTSADVDLFTRMHSSQIGRENYGGLADPVLDKLLEAERAATGTAERRHLQVELHRRLHELAPYAFISADRRGGLVARGVGGFAQASPTSFARYLWRELQGVPR